MLREAIDQGIRSYLTSMYDPAAALACEAAGVGASVSISLGGHTDDLHVCHAGAPHPVGREAAAPAGRRRVALTAPLRVGRRGSRSTSRGWCGR
jgi:microcystin degradation protein MlrC